MEKITIEAIDAINQRFVLVNFNSKIKKDEHDNLIFTEVFKNDIYFSVGNADPKDIFTELQANDWQEIFKEHKIKEGDYSCRILFSIHVDSDDYSSWNYYEIEESEFCFLEEYNEADIHELFK